VISWKSPLLPCYASLFWPHPYTCLPSPPFNLQATYPDTKLLLINVLPRVRPPVKDANRRLAALARRHRVAWSTCGADINPFNKSMLFDGIHPTGRAQTKLLRCLAPLVAQLAGRVPLMLLSTAGTSAGSTTTAASDDAVDAAASSLLPASPSPAAAASPPATMPEGAQAPTPGPEPGV